MYKVFQMAGCIHTENIVCWRWHPKPLFLSRLYVSTSTCPSPPTSHHHLSSCTLHIVSQTSGLFCPLSQQQVPIGPLLVAFCLLHVSIYPLEAHLLPLWCQCSNYPNSDVKQRANLFYPCVISLCCYSPFLSVLKHSSMLS